MSRRFVGRRSRHSALPVFDDILRDRFPSAALFQLVSGFGVFKGSMDAWVRRLGILSSGVGNDQE